MNPTGTHKQQGSSKEVPKITPSTGGRTNKSSTGDKTGKRVCDGFVGCNDYHCDKVHRKGHVPPKSCWRVDHGKHCSICGNAGGGASGSKPSKIAEERICKFGKGCGILGCTFKHTVEQSDSPPVEPKKSLQEEFPSLGKDVSPIEQPTGNGWATAVGGSAAGKTELDFSNDIASILDCFPEEVFGVQKPGLEERLKACKTVNELIEFLNSIKSAFTEFVSVANNPDAILNDTLLVALFDPFMKTVFVSEDFPVLPDDAIESILVVSTACDKFIRIFDDITTTFSVVDEPSADEFEEFMDDKLITDVTGISYAIRQLVYISKEITEIDIILVGPVNTMIAMLSSIAGSNISATTWCSPALLKGVLISAKKLLEQVNDQRDEKDKKEQERLYNLFMNPTPKKLDPQANFCAYLYAISFQFGNEQVCVDFRDGLDEHDKALFDKNLGKFFKCLVEQIYKHLVQKPELTKTAFDEKNPVFLSGILTAAFESMTFELSQDSNGILNFLKQFKLEKENSLSPNFVDFLYRNHTFPGNEGNQAMSKLLNWYMTTLKQYLKLEIVFGDNFTISVLVRDSVADEKGEMKVSKINVSGIVMDFLFKLVCYAEVCRQKNLRFPFGNISNENSLAKNFNITGKTVSSSFQKYQKRTNDTPEQLPNPYDPAFKENAKLKSNEDVVKFFLDRLLTKLHEELDESFHSELPKIEASFSPPNGDLVAFNKILALFACKENASFAVILKGIQVLLRKSDFNFLLALLKEDFSAARETSEQTIREFSVSKHQPTVKSLADNFISGMCCLMNIIVSSGITLSDVTKVHDIMRKIYMSNNRELYLHSCLIAIILALTRTYKITFQDVYNMVCVALKDPKWVNSSMFSQESSMKRAVGGIQPNRVKDFDFSWVIGQSKVSVLTPREMFWFDSMFKDVKSGETEDKINEIKGLLESTIPILLFNEIYTKVVLSGGSSLIDLLTTMFSFRLTGDTFRDFMILFGINLGEISNKSDNHTPPSDPKNFMQAFAMSGLSAISTVAASTYRQSFFDHKNENPTLRNSISSYDFFLVKKSIRLSVQNGILNKVIKDALGFNSIDLAEGCRMKPFDLLSLLNKETNEFKIDPTFIKCLFDAINSGFSLNTSASFKAKNERFVDCIRFIKSREGEVSTKLTFAGQIEEKESDEFQTPDQVYAAMQELFKNNNLDFSNFQKSVSSLPPTIMCCNEMTRLFPQSDENPTVFPENHMDTFTRFLGNLVKPDMGGIDAFNDFTSMENDSILMEYALLIGFGLDDDVFTSNAVYESFLYLLNALQFFLSQDVAATVQSELDLYNQNAD